MKFLLQIFLLSLLSINSLYSQRSERAEKIEEAFNFIEGQQFTLDYIKQNFPTLQIKAEKASLNFQNQYKIAIKSISSEMQHLHQKNFSEFINNHQAELERLFRQKKMSYKQAQSIIESTEHRTKGHINPKILATLNTFQFYQNPENEFIAGHIKEYEVSSSSDGKELFLKIKIPISWELMDESQNSTLFHFRNQNGHGPLEMLIQYRKLSKDERLVKNLNKPRALGLDQTKKGIVSAQQPGLKPQKIKLQYKPVSNSKSTKYVDSYYFSTADFLISVKIVISAQSSTNKNIIAQKNDKLISLINKSLQLEKENFLSSKF